MTELQLDYPALSDGVLFILAENTRGRLEDLTVEASGSDFTLPVLSDNAWKKLAKECPKLKVSFIISKYKILNSYQVILPKPRKHVCVENMF